MSPRTNRRFLWTESHDLTETCFKKCVTGPIKNGKLDRGEETCMANCTERFFDANLLTMKHLQNIRQG